MISVIKFYSNNIQTESLVLKRISHSKTSNDRPSKKRTTSLQWTAHLPPIDFTIHYKYITNTFQTSEKWTLLNSKKRTLIRPQCTMANKKLPPKKGSEATPT